MSPIPSRMPLSPLPHERGLDLLAADDRAVDAEPHVSAPAWGTAQPKQAPYPHAIGASIASSQATPRSVQSDRTDSSIAGGPQA